MSRPMKVIYPDYDNGINNVNDVEYTYYPSPAGATGIDNDRGRLQKLTDATGYKEFWYDEMGNVIKEDRLCSSTPHSSTYLFETEYEYESWGRLKKMIYPDDEEVTYDYDLGGNLTKVTGEMYNEDSGMTEAYDFISDITYDHFEQKTSCTYGNETTTTYSYEPELRRLSTQVAIAGDGITTFLSNTYLYDKVGNITSLVNGGSMLNGLGGDYGHAYEYDKLNRLVYGDGYWNEEGGSPGNGDYEADYTLHDMEYDDMHRITRKHQEANKNGGAFDQHTYDRTYHYTDNAHPRALSQVSFGTSTMDFTYDPKGNMLTQMLTEGGVSSYQKQALWDERNLMRGIVSNGYNVQHNFYDVSGERVLKAKGEWYEWTVDGTTEKEIYFSPYTVYPSGYLTLKPSVFNTTAGVYTKHYYSGSERIVSRLAGESRQFIFKDLGGDLTTRQMDGELEDFKEQLGADNLSFYPTTIWDIFNPPTDPELEETKQYLCESGRKCPQDVLYYFHKDHLGSAAFLTDSDGEAYQFFLYLPWGESLASQKVAFGISGFQFSTPYQFNGKELDSETGLYNYGARYYDPSLSVWMGVDPLADKYSAWSPYNYVLNNPIIHTDPDGRSVDGEYELDANGEWQKVSNKGDAIGVDFYHFDAVGKDSPQKTFVTDRKGNWNIINNGRYALQGKTRGNDVNYETITDEFMSGTGPEHSLFEGNHPANSEIEKHYLFRKQITLFNLGGDGKGEHNGTILGRKKGVNVSWGVEDVPRTGSDNMQAQMMGSYSASFYKLGDKTLTLLQDSKSRYSLYFHLPWVKNYSREEGVPIRDLQWGVERARSQRTTNTYQSYLFFAN